MADAESDSGFRVTDRRGRSREEESSPAPPAPGPDAARQSRATTGPPPQAISPPPEAAGRSLVGLFVMLAGSALGALGEAPDPMTGERGQDLEQAAELIDVLMLLREKTEGHRTTEETSVLEEVLYDLHVRYTQIMKSFGSPPGPARS